MSRKRGSRSRGTQANNGCNASQTLRAYGSSLKTLSEKEKAEINAGVRHILSEIGFYCLTQTKNIVVVLPQTLNVE